MRFTRLDTIVIGLVTLLLLISINLRALVPSPITYPTTPFPSIPSTVQAGKKIGLDITRCSSWPSDLTYDVDWVLVGDDQTRYPLPPSIVTSSPGCAHGVAQQFIPDVEPGRYRIIRVSHIQTFIANYSVPSESVPFVVTR